SLIFWPRKTLKNALRCLRFPARPYLVPCRKPELPSSLHIPRLLADLRSTALPLSSFFLTSLALLLKRSLCARGIHGHECRTILLSVTPWTQSVIDNTLE